MTPGLEETLLSAAALRRELVARDPAFAAAPVTTLRCPVHGNLVAADGDGQLITLCPGCVAAAAIAELLIHRHSTKEVLMQALTGTRLRTVKPAARARQ